MKRCSAYIMSHVCASFLSRIFSLSFSVTQLVWLYERGDLSAKAAAAERILVLEDEEE